MRRAISLQLDHELSELAQQRLAGHIGACEACAKFAISLENLTDALCRSAPQGRPD